MFYYVGIIHDCSIVMPVSYSYPHLFQICFTSTVPKLNISKAQTSITSRVWMFNKPVFLHVTASCGWRRQVVPPKPNNCHSCCLIRRKCNSYHYFIKSRNVHLFVCTTLTIHQNFQRTLNALPFGSTCLVNQLFLQTLPYFLYCFISRRPTSLVESETLCFLYSSSKVGNTVFLYISHEGRDILFPVLVS